MVIPKSPHFPVPSPWSKWQTCDGATGIAKAYDLALGWLILMGRTMCKIRENWDITDTSMC